MTTATIEAPCKPALKRPALYNVMFVDDDITTFKTVVDILVSYFNKSEEEAYDLTVEVHLMGSAIVGIYPKDVAETRVSLAKAEIRNRGYPLRMQLLAQFNPFP